MDYISLRDAFYATVPRDLHRKIFDQTMAMQISGCTYNDIKGIGRDLWISGFRPKPNATHGSPVKPPQPTNRFQNYLVQAKKVNTEGWSAADKTKYFSAYKCFYCGQMGHISNHCPAKNDAAERLSKLAAENQRLHVKVAQLLKPATLPTSRNRKKPPPALARALPPSDDDLEASGSERYAPKSTNRLDSVVDSQVI